MFLRRAVVRLFKTLNKTTSRPEPEIYEILCGVCGYWWQTISRRRGYRQNIRQTLDGLCGPYRRQWVRLQRLKSDIVGAKVRGVAHLDDRIYVVYSNEDRIGVYMDEKPYTSLGCIPIANMRFPLDVSACPTRRNLYVADWGAGGDEGGQVLEINLSNRDIEVRSRICLQGVDKPRKLSLNKDDLLIVCGNRLVFYRLDEFVEIKHIDLPENSEPQHAVVTASGTFLVGHGQQLDLPHRVTELSADGKTQIRSYGGNTSGRLVGQLSWPAHLCLGTEDGGGRVILADCDNDRLLMLTAELQLERLLINKDDDDIDKPRRLCYVKRSGTLLVGLDFGFVDVYVIRRRRFDR